MNLLIYLEPALFRDDPLLLLPWAGWVSRIAKANPSLQVSCVSNHLLVQQLRSFSAVPCHGLTQADVHGDMRHDRVAYAQDLYAPADAPLCNHRLVSALARVGQLVRPDLVLSFTQNRYLRTSFGAPVLFSEMGALPRSRCRASLFFDVLGHQHPSLLTYNRGQALRTSVPSDVAHFLNSHFEANVAEPLSRDPRSNSLKEQLAKQAGGRRLALLAMQPPDWLTYEGLHAPLPPADLLLTWAAQLPTGWAGVVAYHPGHRLSEASERLLGAESDRLIFLPRELAQGVSEPLLRLVDGVVTISSTLALQGALLGKNVVAAPNSAWSSMAAAQLAHLEQAPVLTEAERTSLLFFLTCRFYHSLDRVLDEPGYFARFLVELKRAGFAPDLYFDGSKWNRGRAKELLSIEA